MNENEKYFKISKSGHVHTLSSRTPFKWKELMIWTSASFVFLLIWTGWLAVLLITILTSVGYMLYRFAAWVFYAELKIDEKSGKIIRLKKFLDSVQKEELIAENFDPNRFEFTELIRSGKTKYLMSYRTHKNNELLILRSRADKESVQKYILEKISGT
ncbi:hypothetical protein [Flagellimonas flava]|uniref:hypothetical protein n=1 Tax=Flagellimonas flava TaxID=570519 RepID=UPI003D64790E